MMRFVLYIFSHKIFFILKVASDHQVAKSNDQFLVFTILGPPASFDTNNLTHFLKYVLCWAASESQCLGLLFLFFLVSVPAPSPFSQLQPPHLTNTKCLSGPLLFISKLIISSSLMTLNVIYMQKTYICIFSPCLSSDI